MDKLQTLVGKTIATIEDKSSIIIDNLLYQDACFKITFTDGTTWKMASWDYEGYSSGVTMAINNETVKMESL